LAVVWPSGPQSRRLAPAAAGGTPAPQRHVALPWFFFRPHGGHQQSHANTQGDFDKPVNRDNPRGLGARHEHDYRQRDSRVTISVSFHMK